MLLVTYGSEEHSERVPRRVVITGLGFVSPIGAEFDAFWSALVGGRSGIRRLERFDPRAFNCQVGGEVPPEQFTELVEPRLLRTTSHATQLGLAALSRALANGALNPRCWQDPSRVALLLGSAVGGLLTAEQQALILYERGMRRINPFLASGSLPFAVAAELAALANAHGCQTTITTGCTASAQAIALAQQLVAYGDADVAIAGGAESPLTFMVFASMGRTMELARDASDPPRASRPFDRRHSGIVLSEGACMVILEPLEHALARGATVFAEVVGGASSCDARGLFQSDLSGETGGKTIRELLSRHGLGPNNIQWICAHANASPAFDRKETAVVKFAFGEWAPQLPVSSIKAVLGHPFGASGAFQTLAACLAFRHGFIPPTHFLEDPADGCDLDYVPGAGRQATLEHILVTSYGYGGTNSYLLLRHPESSLS